MLRVQQEKKGDFSNLLRDWRKSKSEFGYRQCVYSNGNTMNLPNPDRIPE